MNSFLEQKTLQQTRLSQRMEQSLRLLQMDHLELAAYIREMATGNPVMDLDAPPEESLSSLKREWLSRSPAAGRVEMEEEEGRPIERLEDDRESMDQFLLDQLSELDLPPARRRAAAFLIGCLDDRGYLSAPLEELACQGWLPLPALADAHELVRQMDPPGVGARDLADCILLQLERQGPVEPAVRRVVEDHLEQLARGSCRAIGEAVGLPAEEVRRLAGRISRLNPKPCASLGRPVYQPYVQPDLVVVQFPDHFEILVSDYLIPRITVNQDYGRMLGDQLDDQTAQYLETKIRQAQWVVQAVRDRRTTLLRIGRRLVERQKDFFRQGPRFLRPLTLSELAAELDLHPSTVSRAVSGKYLQSSFGTFPLRYFFTAAPDSPSQAEVGAEGIRQRLRELIGGEDPSCPRSDQILAQLLADQGIALSRRTVAKYRDQLGIPPAAARRR